jgi:hypothetical protein
MVTISPESTREGRNGFSGAFQRIKFREITMEGGGLIVQFSYDGITDQLI